jgi:O-antigen/teichoic acid export membrane protein
MFPALSRIQADKARIKRVYLRSISSIALITFPLMLGLLVVADSFILTIYGPKWGAVIPVLQILCMVGLLQSILSTIGWLYTSQGRTDLQLWWTVGGGLLTFLAFAIGVQWGVIGVAIAYAVRVYGTIYFAIAIPGKLINMTFFEVVKTVASIFGCAVVMAVLVWGVGLLLPLTWPHWAYLAVQVPFGALVYGGLVHLFKLRAYQDVQGILLEQWRLLHKRRKLQASESIG